MNMLKVNLHYFRKKTINRTFSQNKIIKKKKVKTFLHVSLPLGCDNNNNEYLKFSWFQKFCLAILNLSRSFVFFFFFSYFVLL